MENYKHQFVHVQCVICRVKSNFKPETAIRAWGWYIVYTCNSQNSLPNIWANGHYDSGQIRTTMRGFDIISLSARIHQKRLPLFSDALTSCRFPYRRRWGRDYSYNWSIHNKGSRSIHNYEEFRILRVPHMFDHNVYSSAIQRQMASEAEGYS